MQKKNKQKKRVENKEKSVGFSIFKKSTYVVKCELGVHQRGLRWIIVHYRGL